MSSTVHIIVRVGMCGLLLICTFLLMIVAMIAREVPASLSATPPLSIYDRSGIHLYTVHTDAIGEHTPMEYTEIPKDIIDITLSTEDHHFFSHIGISIGSILRAARDNVRAGSVVSGGSTITQQVVRMHRGKRARSLLDKAQEALLAIIVDARFAKEEILIAYLNNAYFGHRAYGIAAAADVYFDKSVHQLSKAEVALLIGLLQSPSRYDPYRSMNAAKERQERVLDTMVHHELVDDTERAQLAEQHLTLADGSVRIRAPHFVMWIAAQHPAVRGRLDTTLDAHLQHEVQRIVRYQLEKLVDKNVTSAAVVVYDTPSGELLAMVGSHDYFDATHDGSVNRVTARRQPGSTLKPFAYALAFEDGATAATTIEDVDVHLTTGEGNPYTPRNYDYEHHGLVRYREALANSYNIPAIKIAQRVGIDRLLHTLRRAGLSSLTRSAEHYGAALVLGDGEVSLLELTQAYGIFAHGGVLPAYSHLIERAHDTSKQTRIFSEETSWLIRDILSDGDARVEEFGLRNPLVFDFPVAAKTGTTPNARDNWLIGFSSERLVGVWVGNADNSPMHDTSGITGAGPLFHDVMNTAMKGVDAQEFKKPHTIVSQEICELSGLLSSADCTHTVDEFFVDGTQPTETDFLHRNIAIDKRNGLQAEEGACDERFIEHKTFITFPPTLRRWAQEQGHEESPQAYSPFCSSATKAVSEGASYLRIVHPKDNDSFWLDPLVPNDAERIALRAETNSNEAIQWYANEEQVGKATSMHDEMYWQPKVGTWRIRAETRNKSAYIDVTIVDRQN